MRNIFYLIVVGLVFGGCTAPTTPIQMALSEPVAMTLICLGPGDGGMARFPNGECSASDGQQLMAFMANGPTGDVAIVNMWTGQAVDYDPMIPGLTRLYLGMYISDVASNPVQPYVYAADSGVSELYWIHASSLEHGSVELPGPAERLLVWPDGSFVVASIPSLGQLAKVSIGADGKVGAVEAYEMSGMAYSLALVDSERILVGYIDRHYVSLVSVADFVESEGERVALVPACSDGLDNDGDGLVDAADPGCMDPFDNDEVEPLWCSSPENAGLDGCVVREELGECADGLDNDGDGLADLEDPGCMDRWDYHEGSDAGQCADGIDNDGDGKVDVGGDSKCKEAGDVEAAPVYGEGIVSPCADGWDNDGDGLTDGDDPECASSGGLFESLPFVCSNGVDDDGDGLVDWPEDPDCFGAGGTSESSYPSAMPELSVSGDGTLAYVTYRGLNQVVVLDLLGKALVDVNVVTEATDRRIRKLKNRWGIEFSYAPTGSAFLEGEEELLAFVVDEGGVLSKVRARQGGQPLHHIVEEPLAEGEFRQSSANKPRLYDRSGEVQLGYTPPPGYPNFGPLLVRRLSEESDQRSYYGITFSEERRSQRSETWYVEYEGALPGTSAGLAMPRSSGDVWVIGVDLCGIGVEEGDLFCLPATASRSCEGVESEGEYCWEISEAYGDRVVLKPGVGDYEGEEGVARGVELSPGCFDALGSFRVRVAGEYLVTGSRSGYLHNVIRSSEGRCAMDPDGDPTFTGRAVEAEVSESLISCSMSTETPGLVLNTFSNPVFSLDLFPGCKLSQEGVPEVVTASRGTVWSFSVTSGFIASVIQVGYLPLDLELVVETLRLYILDMAGRTVKGIDLEEYKVFSSFY